MLTLIVRSQDTSFKFSIMWGGEHLIKEGSCSKEYSYEGRGVEVREGGGVLIEFFPNQVLLLPIFPHLRVSQVDRKTIIIARKYYPKLKKS